MAMGKIDAVLALQLRRRPHFLTWREIGGVLAMLDERDWPYLDSSVIFAVRRYQRRWAA